MGHIANIGADNGGDLNNLAEVKKVEVQEGGTGSKAAHIAATSTTPTGCGGDVDKRAKAGADVELLKKKMPADSEESAKMVLDGVYTGDARDVAKRNFRERQPQVLPAQAGPLKTTEVHLRHHAHQTVQGPRWSAPGRSTPPQGATSTRSPR